MPRPREFDYEEVVQKAMNLFWRKGYLATSVQELVAETGVNRASLYSTFHDKHALFLEALGHYGEAVVPSRTCILERPGAGLRAIREYFETVADDLLGKARGRGCLMVNSAVELAGEDPEVADKVRAHLGRLEKAFAVALTGACEQGDLADRSRIRTLARFLVGAAQGLMVVGKTTPEPRLLQEIIEPTLQALK